MAYLWTRNTWRKTGRRKTNTRSLQSSLKVQKTEQVLIRLLLLLLLLLLLSSLVLLLLLENLHFALAHQRLQRIREEWIWEWRGNWDWDFFFLLGGNGLDGLRKKLKEIHLSLSGVGLSSLSLLLSLNNLLSDELLELELERFASFFPVDSFFRAAGLKIDWLENCLRKELSRAN